MNRHPAHAFILMVIALLLGGCETAEKNWQATVLQDNLFKYEKAIRWGAFQQAHYFRGDIPPDEKEPDWLKLRDIKITGYTQMSADFSEDYHSYEQLIEIKYYNQHEMKVRSLMDKQKWELDETDKTWHIMTPLPEFE